MLLSARKNTKSWEPVPWGPIVGAPKSSIDGQRESVLHESLYADFKKGTLSAEKLRREYFVKKSERLCGVGLLKRIGQELGRDGDLASKPAFHSATHVTAGPLLVRLERSKERGRDALATYLETLRRLGVDVEQFQIRPGAQAFATPRDPIARDAESNDKVPKIPRTFAQRADGGGLDGYLLFEDRLLEVFEMYAPSYATKTPKEREELVRLARAALTQFFKAIGHDGGPTAYYALLLADGDQMGKAINHLPEMKDHQALSGALEKFADGCREIVERNGGSFVYSGGDDVLALLPLHTALACADELRHSFSDSIRLACSSLASVPTLSVGLGIAHHLEAMSEVRALAKQAESAAKRKRNSLGIAVSKRSGGTVEITGQWDESPPLHDRINTWCSLFRAEDLPDGVAFELEEAVVPFEIRDPADSKTPADVEALKKVILALARRVIGRKRSDRGTDALDTTTADLLAARFKTDEDPILVTKKLSSELQVARLFLKAYDSAWGEVNR
jgi:CRISPR-associated protein Cmr2